MNKEESTAFIIKELGKHHSRNEIMRSLCERTGMPWGDAEKLVRQVEVDHSHDITASQSPVIIVLGIVTILGGIGLIIYGLQYFADLATKDTLGIAISARSAFYKIGSLITGVGMVIGGIVGLWKTILTLFKEDDQ